MSSTEHLGHEETNHSPEDLTTICNVIGILYANDQLFNNVPPRRTSTCMNHFRNGTRRGLTWNDIHFLGVGSWKESACWAPWHVMKSIWQNVIAEPAVSSGCTSAVDDVTIQSVLTNQRHDCFEGAPRKTIHSFFSINNIQNPTLKYWAHMQQPPKTSPSAIATSDASNKVYVSDGSPLLVDNAVGPRARTLLLVLRRLVPPSE